MHPLPQPELKAGTNSLWSLEHNQSPPICVFHCPWDRRSNSKYRFPSLLPSPTVTGLVVPDCHPHGPQARNTFQSHHGVLSCPIRANGSLTPIVSFTSLCFKLREKCFSKANAAAYWPELCRTTRHPPPSSTGLYTPSVTSLTTHPWAVMTVVMSTAKIYLEFLFTSNCIRKMKGSLAKLELRRDERAAEQTLLGMEENSNDTHTHNPIRKLLLPISKME